MVHNVFVRLLNQGNSVDKKPTALTHAKAISDIAITAKGELKLSAIAPACILPRGPKPMARTSVPMTLARIASEVSISIIELCMRLKPACPIPTRIKMRSDKTNILLEKSL